MRRVFVLGPHDEPFCNPERPTMAQKIDLDLDRLITEMGPTWDIVTAQTAITTQVIDAMPFVTGVMTVVMENQP